jgi:uncharacterized protein (TIGR01777 family)
MFAYRHRITRDDLRIHQRMKGPAMKVLVSGPHGLIGSALRSFLTTGEHDVVGLTRSKSSDSEIAWDPNAGQLDAAQLRGFDAVIHLAGENIAGARWTDEVKNRIRDSRVKGTTLLCQQLAQLEMPPKVLVCASAIGIYGDRGDERLDETSQLGNDFLADVCRQWEAATEPARARGIRVVNLRFGIVLSPAGGALAKMLLPFKMGVGGVVGSGQQYMSWITLDDAVGAIHHALVRDDIAGPVNGTAPNPITNREFTKTLGKVLSRPTIIPMPAFAARLAFGEMADALLLAGARVIPAKLESTNYEFRFPQLEGALRHLLGR